VQPTPTAPSVVVSQAFVDDATRAFKEVAALREALARVQAVNGLSAAERKAVDATLAAMDSLMAVKDRIPLAYAALDEVRIKTIEAQNVLIERLLTQLNKKPSTWQKILGVLKRIADIAVGIGIGAVVR
jgi:hypothetical protein